MESIGPRQSGQVTDSPLINVRGLKKIYSTPAGDFPALRQVDLQIERGEFIAVLGKSGAGKSTLINMLSGIDRPTAGLVEIDGVAIHELSDDELARWRGLNLGVVFQFFQLLPSITLVENITLAMDFNGTSPPGGRHARAIELLDQVGIGEHGGKVPSKISGGQQQRAAIARALANDPQVILADEPTGNLDSQTAGGIMDLFAGLNGFGKTLLIVTHDHEVASRADRILHISEGVLTSQSAAESLEVRSADSRVSEVDLST
jgi:putative ABC transport system ATP-binding protein